MFCLKRVIPLLVLFLFCSVTAFAQSNPTTRPRNPSTTLACGFPVHGIYNSGNAPRSWTLSSNCTLPLHTSESWQAFLHFDGGDDDNNCPTYYNFTIDGAGYTVYGATDQRIMLIEACTKVILKNITFVLDTMPDSTWPLYFWEHHFMIIPFGRLSATDLTVQSSTGGSIFYIRAGRASFTNLALRDNHTASPNQWSKNLIYIDSRDGNDNEKDSNAKATFRDTWICGNTGTRRLFYINANATVELNGALNYEDNTYEVGGSTYNSALFIKGGNSTFTNNSSRGYCTETAAAKQEVPCNPHCWLPPLDKLAINPLLENCFQPLGVIGKICRPWIDPEIPYFTIWRVDRYSRGHFVLGVTQPQVDARKTAGLIATSADARVGVYVVGPECFVRDAHGHHPRVTKDDPVGCLSKELTRLRDEARSGAPGEPLGWERYIVVAKGPNNPVEEKTHLAIFDNAVSGHVIGTIDLMIGPPGLMLDAQAYMNLSYAAPARPAVVEVPFVTPQEAQEDGAQMHVVGSGDTLHAIAVAYDVSPWKIANQNDLADEGRWLSVGQELLIRSAAEARALAADDKVVHVVQAGDTVNVIAVRYRVKPAEIVSLNSLANDGRMIYPGQKLVIREG